MRIYSFNVRGHIVSGSIWPGSDIVVQLAESEDTVSFSLGEQVQDKDYPHTTYAVVDAIAVEADKSPANYPDLTGLTARRISDCQDGSVQIAYENMNFKKKLPNTQIVSALAQAS